MVLSNYRNHIKLIDKKGAINQAVNNKKPKTKTSNYSIAGPRALPRRAGV